MDKHEVHRAHKRAKGAAPVTCQGTMGRLLDISRGGMAFNVGNNFERFVIGESYQVTVKLPRTGNNPEGVEFSAEGLVRHLSKDDLKNRLMIGMEFHNLSEPEADALNRVILFFAQNFANLHALDRIFSIPNKNDSKLNRRDLERIFQRILQDFDQMPEPTRKKLVRFMESIEKELDLRAST